MAPFPPWRQELASPAFRRELLSECVGTFSLLFLTLGCVVFTSDGGLTPAHSVRLALNNGSTVAVLAYALGDISALMNPAVTLAFFLTRRLSPFRAAALALAQCAAAAAGAAVVRALSPVLFERVGGGANFVSASASLAEALGVEAGATFLLLLTVLAASDARRHAAQPHLQALAPLMCGLAVACAMFLALPVTGCSLNPARTLGVALASGNWDSHWLFWLGPCAGAAAAALAYWVLGGEGGGAQ